MKNHNTSKIIQLLVLSFFLIKCTEDIPVVIEEPTINFPETTEQVSVSILGSVEDVEGLPLRDAIVTCLNCNPIQEITTDEKGDFSFFNVDAKGNSAYLSVKSPGKYDGYRRMGLVAGRNNYTRIQLRDKLSIGSLSAMQGGELSHDSGARISLPAGGIVQADDSFYSGEYEIYMSWIDPIGDDLNMTMMGDLSAINAENNLVGLSTFGMLQVELEAPDGSSLNIDNESNAILEFPIPSSLKDSAPSTISLWFYNEVEGYWIEEGSAQLEGDRYVGEVSHFSTWNVDVKIDPVDICGSISVGTLDNQIDLSFYQIKLSGDSFQGVGGWLCDDGSFRFRNVPSSEVLTLDIFDLCEHLVESIEIGTYESEKVELDPIIVDPENPITYVMVTGMAVDCDNLPLTQGVVSFDLEFDTYIFPIASDGSFEAILTTCGEFETHVQVVNTLDFSASVPIALSLVSQDLNLGTIQPCGETPEEYFYFKCEHSNRTLEPFVTEPISYRLDSLSNEYLITVEVSDSSFHVTASFADVPERNTAQRGPLTIWQTISPLSINVNFEFIALGPEISPGVFEYIEGRFEGGDVNAIINGSFRVKPE